MGGASSWYTILSITGLLLAVWLAGKVSKKIGMSTIVLEVATGLVLGPSVANLVPKEMSKCYVEQVTDCDTRKDQLAIANEGIKFCDLDAYMKADKYSKGCWDTGFWGADLCKKIDCNKYTLKKTNCRRLEESDADNFTGDVAVPRKLASDKKGRTDFDDYSDCVKSSCELDVAIKCATVPDFFTMIGHTGVAMMIFESGMHFDFEQAKTVGPWACLIAVLGTFLPLISGCGLAVAFGFDLMPDAISAGTSLAPTSVGIALKLLHEAQALQEYFGQAVMTAAFVDDVLSLILFSVIFSLGPDMSFLTFLPLILGCVFMVLAIIGCVVFWPPFMRWLFAKVPDGPGTNSKVTKKDEVMWILMFLTFAAYAQITHLCGTHLWGCFIAGMCFSTDHHAHHVWVRQVKRVTCWFMRIFFACTLAWAIPVKELFNITAFWKGTLMGIGPCILTKVLCAPFMGAPRFVIGWAMVGRAEFAYFIAIMAKALKMMDEKLFAILIWALIYATIFAPLIFGKVLARYMVKIGKGTEKSINDVNAASGHMPDFEEEENMAKRISEKKEATEKEAALHTQVAQKDAALTDSESKIRELNKKIEELQQQVASAKIETNNGGDGLTEQERDNLTSI